MQSVIHYPPDLQGYRSNQAIKLRLPVSILLALLVTFSLFAMMAALISQDNSSAPTEELPTITTFILKEQRSPTITKPKLLPPPLVTRPPEVQKIKLQSTANDPNQLIGLVIARPNIDRVPLKNGFDSAGGEARPIVRVPPKYPLEASRAGLEGWVELEFTIDATGTVKNVKVIDSQPKRVFDNEAKRALKKWKYKPQLADGKPIDQSGMLVVLDFKLES